MKISPYDKLQALRTLSSHSKEIKRVADSFGLIPETIPKQVEDEPFFPLILKYPEMFILHDGRPIYTRPVYSPYDLGEKTPFEENSLVCLLVDLTYPKKIILEEIARILKCHVRHSKSRDKKTTVDIWKVYKMREIERKNLLQITKELFGITKRPADDKIASSRYRQVRNAYKKAEKIIQAISQSHK